MRSGTLTVTVPLSLFGVASADTAAKSLYERLGGKNSIVSVVDDFVGIVAQDKRIRGYVAKTDNPHLKWKLWSRFTQALESLAYTRASK